MAFKDKFKDKIQVQNKDGSRTHLTTGATTAAPSLALPPPRKPGAPSGAVRQLPLGAVTRPNQIPLAKPEQKQEDIKVVRKVEYKPYTIEDYKRLSAPEADPRLGYRESEETKAARVAKEKMKDYSKGVKAFNQADATPQGRAKYPEPTVLPAREEARERHARMLEYGKNNVPKPKVKRAEGGAGVGGKKGGEDDLSDAGPEYSELEVRAMQHFEDKATVAAIKRELRL